MMHNSCPEFLCTTFLNFPFLTFHRATVKKGVTFRTATPSNSLLWDITLDMGAGGVIAVVCQRKAPIPGKRQVCSFHFVPLCVMYFMYFMFFTWPVYSLVSSASKWHFCNVCPARNISVFLHLQSKRQTICAVQGVTAAYYRGILCFVLGWHLLFSLSTGCWQVLR